MSDPVITVTATVMDGQVARWYRSVEDATIHRAVLSASRSGVSVYAEFLTDVPQEWIDAAKAAHAELAADRNADVRHLATHRNRGFSNGPLEPVEKGDQS
jgi:dihydrodipicolinate synthase/N-acetylneuraminate lyase